MTTNLEQQQKALEAFTEWWGTQLDDSPTYQATFEAGYCAALAAGQQALEQVKAIDFHGLPFAVAKQNILALNEIDAKGMAISLMIQNGLLKKYATHPQATEPKCTHEWVSSINGIVQGGYVCRKCYAPFAEPASSTDRTVCAYPDCKCPTETPCLQGLPAPSTAGELPERDTSKPSEAQGLFRKFDVTRVDGSSAPGCKHHGCEYFVLDVDHDPHAKAALQAYAVACAQSHPQLSADLISRHGAAHSTAGERKTLETMAAEAALEQDPTLGQPAQGERAQVVEDLLMYAGDNGYSHIDYADTMRHAAALLSAPADHIPDAGKMVAAMPVGGLTDEEIISMARTASTENFYKAGRFIRADFEPEEILTFARGILAAASTQPVREPLSYDDAFDICRASVNRIDVLRKTEAAHGITKKGDQ